MIRYVVGFMFSPDRKYVALIRKTHPDWQKGKLNGVGGHVMNGEGYQAAMVREFLEETGVATNPEDWTHKLTIVNDKVGYELAILYTISDKAWLVSKMTDEEPITCPIVITSPIYRREVIPNLAWIIPLCLDDSIMPGIVMHDLGDN